MRSKIVYIVCVLSVILAFSCKDKQEFKLKGSVENASGETLYLEHIGVSGVAVLDSVKLKDNGSFSFRQPRPEAPDFYRLKLKNQFINIAVDSTEIITVKADVSAGFAKNYMVEGSDNCTRLKELTLLQLQASDAYNRLLAEQRKKPLSAEDFQREVINVTGNYKQEAQKYILQDPRSSAAYFALFQQIDNMLIFDPYEKTDNKMYAVVATSWDVYHGNSVRSKHLHALTMQALKFLRQPQAESSYPGIEVREAISYFEIALPDVNGNIVKLSDVIGQGKVIMLDFSAYQSRFSPVHNMDLGEIYQKYQPKGLEIFQVSLDGDLNFWQNAAANIPWICVRDPENVYSRAAATYNVKELPATFLLNRKGEIVKRIESVQEMEAEVKKVL